MKRPGLEWIFSLCRSSWIISPWERITEVLWENCPTRSQIAIVLILNSQKGDFSHTWLILLSLTLAKHIILAPVFLNSSFNPSCTLFFFLFSSSSPHNGVLELACEVPVANKRACVVHRWRMLTGDFSFRPSVQDVVLVAWSHFSQGIYTVDIASDTNPGFSSLQPSYFFSGPLLVLLCLSILLTLSLSSPLSFLLSFFPSLFLYLFWETTTTSNMATTTTK